MPIQSYRELVVWQRSIDLVVAVYQITAKFPRDEQFGLTSQARRAAVSVATNIAEGSGRDSTPDLLRFLSTSRGSLREVETLLTISERLGFATPDDNGPAWALANVSGKMLTRLRQSLRAKL